MRIQVGTVKEIWRYPVKSMEGEILQEAQIEKLGIVGDRSWAIRDEIINEISTVRKLPRLLSCTARFEEQPLPGQTGTDVPHVHVQLPNGTSFNTRDTYRQYKEAIGKKSTRTLPISYPKMAPCRH